MSECTVCEDEFPEHSLVECAQCHSLVCTGICAESSQDGWTCAVCEFEPCEDVQGEPIGYAGRVWILEDLVKELEAENASVKAELQALRDTFKTPRGWYE